MVSVRPVGLENRRKLFVDVATTFGARFAGLPLAMASSILLARSLRPSGKGIYATVATIGDLSLVLGTLGISTAAVYFLAQPSETLERTRATVLGLCLVIGTVISAALLAAAVAVSAEGSPGVGAALMAVAPVGVISLGRAALESFFRSQHRIRTINGVAVLASASFLLFVGATALVRSLSATTAIGLRVASYGMGLAALAAAARGAHLTIPRPRLHWPTVRMLLVYGLPYAAYSIVQNFSNRFDYVLLRIFGDARAVGVYSIAVAQGELLWILPTAMGFVLFPRVTALVKDDPDRAAAETALLLRWSLLLGGCGALLLAAIAAPLTRLMYGTPYISAVTPLRILLIGIVVSSALQVLSSFLLGTGRLRLLILVSGTGFGINLGLNLALIPSYGMTGAAISSAASYSVTGFAVVVIARRLVPELGRHGVLPLPKTLVHDIGRLRARGGDK